MSNQVFNAHIRAGQPMGDDAGMEEVANWAGYHIEELEAENQRLREALEHIHMTGDQSNSNGFKCANIARRALSLGVGDDYE
jgi:hypothetical protein